VTHAWPVPQLLRHGPLWERILWPYLTRNCISQRPWPAKREDGEVV